MAIEKLKNRYGEILSYRARVKDPTGKWYETPRVKTLEEAKAEEVRLLGLKRKGGKALSDDARKITEKEFWEVWREENRTRVSAGWKISQDQMHRDYVEPVIGKVKMIDIGKPEVGRVLKRMVDLGRSEQLILHVYNLMNRMFGDAVGYYEMLAESPVSKHFHKVKVPKIKRPFLAPDQARKLLEHVRGHYAAPAVWLQLFAGLRVSEVQALRGECLQFSMGQILIKAAFNRKTGLIQSKPKQESWEYVPMVDDLKEYLAGLKRGPDDFVVTGPKGGMLKYGTYLKALASLCQEAGVPVITTHEERHSCTELFVESGASAEDIRRLLNQKSLSATQRYIHRTDERLRTIAGRVKLKPGTAEAVTHKVTQMGNFERKETEGSGSYVH